MSRLWMLLLTAMLSVLVISGCGNDEKANSDEKANTSEENTADTEKEEKEEEAQEKEETTTSAAPGDFKDLIAYMEKETEGTTKVLYENNEPQVHEMDGVTVTLDAYTLVELTDFHTDFSIPFDDETNGGVIIAQYTVKNELDKDAYYMPAFYLSFTGADSVYDNFRDLLPEENQLPIKLSPTNDYLLPAGETVTGYYTYPFGKGELQQALEVSTVAVEIPAAQAVKGEINSPIGKKGQFTLSLNEAGAEKIASNAGFYKDKATTDDMGEKVILKEESGIGKSETLGDVTVTFDGYQFTEFIPNEVEAPRFENFKNGIVLLTARFELDNKSSDSVALSSMSSKLTVNDGTQYTFGEGMLLDYGYNDMIAAGTSGELLQIFILDKEQYDLIWKNKSFEVEVGPIRNQDSEDISKGKTAVFQF